MAIVNITNIVVLDNPGRFLSPFQFEITFVSNRELEEDLEWKMLHLGSSESDAQDEVLDTVYVGPVRVGRHIFVFKADPPDVMRIPHEDAVGISIVLLTCSYRGQEFERIRYLINNEYTGQEEMENPPTEPQFEKLSRHILASKPLVTRNKINWEKAPADVFVAHQSMMDAVMGFGGPRKF